MHLALLWGEQGAHMGEVPVGALVVHDTKGIISTAHNECISQNDPTAHAEVLALRRAGHKLGNYRLQSCTLIVTLEPCLMCAGALVHSRVAGLVYGAADCKAGAVTSCCEGLAHSFHNHTVWHMGGVLSEQCAAVLHKFFHNAR